MAAIAALPTAKPNLMDGAQRSQTCELMDKNPTHAGPTRRDELAQHSEVVWCARGGKFGGSAVEQRAITWEIGAKRRWRA